MKMFMDVAIAYLTILSLNYFALKWNFKLEKKIPKDAFLFVGVGMWIPGINAMTLLLVIAVNLGTLASLLIDKYKNKAKNKSFLQTLFNVEIDGEYVIEKKKEKIKEIQRG